MANVIPRFFLVNDNEVEYGELVCSCGRKADSMDDELNALWCDCGLKYVEITWLSEEELRIRHPQSFNVNTEDEETEESTLTKAILKLEDEMKQSKNPYIKVVGEFLIKHLNENPKSSKEILKAEKTIGKSFEAMRKVAEKKRVGNYAVLTDQEGFEVVLKYFEIEDSTSTKDISSDVTIAKESK